MKLNEFKLNQDPEYLANFEMELEDLKDILDTWGPDSLYAVSYSRFKRDYPLFAKAIIESFLLDMGILTQDEIPDIDNLGDEDGNYWKTGRLIRPEEDWPTLIDGAERLLTFRKDKGIQWEKVYPKHISNESLGEDFNSDVYNALSDVAFDYEVNKEEPKNKSDFEKAEDNFNDQFFDPINSPEDRDGLAEEVFTLTPEQEKSIETICDNLIQNADREVIEYMVEDPYSDDGVWGIDDLWDDPELSEIMDEHDGVVFKKVIDYLKNYLSK
jgi:hypothetical protein